jgi:hypothetical protein
MAARRALLVPQVSSPTPSRASSSGEKVEPSLLKRFLNGAYDLFGTSVSGAQPMFPQVGTSPSLNDTRPSIAVTANKAHDKSADTDLSYSHVLTMSVADQAREVLAALAINKSPLADILCISRPTLYSWLDGSNPTPGNSDRLLTVLRLMLKTNIQGTSPLNARFVRQPLSEDGMSILDLLKGDQQDENQIIEMLNRARDLSDKVARSRESRETHLRNLGYEDPSIEEKAKRLAQNAAMMEWDKNK